MDITSFIVIHIAIAIALSTVAINNNKWWGIFSFHVVNASSS